MNKRLIKLPLLIMFFVLAIFLTTTISKAWYVMIIRVLYQYDDGTTAHETYTGTYDYGDEYYIVSPKIDGYTPDKEVIFGTFTSSKVFTVKYKQNEGESYTLTINYKDENGGKLHDPYVKSYPVNRSYEVSSPNITGYHPDKVKVTGTLTNNTELDVIYYKNNYNLIINYVDKDNNIMHDPYLKECEYLEEYNVQTPFIYGYTPNVSSVSGNILDNVEATVIYSKNLYDLRINYKDENNNVMATQYQEKLEYLDEYNIVSPTVIGYTPDKNTVSGIITEGTYVDVIYRKNSYNLNVNYVDENNNSLAESIESAYYYNDNYSIYPKQITGYTPNVDKFEGTITDNLNLTFIYSKNKYNLTVKYEDEAGNKLLDDKVYEYYYNDDYNIEVPEIDGYTQSDDVLLGNIKDNLEIVVKYYKKDYNLVINYVDEDGNIVHDKYEHTYKYLDEYNITSPNITGYIVDMASVEGIIKNNTEINVTYNHIKYNLSIYYLNEHGEYLIQPYSMELKYGEKYDIVTPVIEGFYTEEERVFGQICGSNIEIAIIYHPYVLPDSGRQVIISITTVVTGCINCLGIAIMIINKKFII